MSDYMSMTKRLKRQYTNELINLEDIADESIEGIVKVDSDNIEQAIEQQLNTSNVSTYALNELDDQEEIIVAFDNLKIICFC